MSQVADKTQALDAITFGPVPSRRLGRSLGVNNIPAKVCSYSCIYCQVGRTTLMTARRRAFCEPKAIVSAVHEGHRQRTTRLDADYTSHLPASRQPIPPPAQPQPPAPARRNVPDK